MAYNQVWVNGAAKCAVVCLLPGQRVDLEGDPFADPNNDDPEFPFEYLVVESVDGDGEGTIRVDFEGGRSFNFPSHHAVDVDAEQE